MVHGSAKIADHEEHSILVRLRLCVLLEALKLVADVLVANSDVNALCRLVKIKVGTQSGSPFGQESTSTSTFHTKMMIHRQRIFVVIANAQLLTIDLLKMRGEHDCV